MLRLIIAATVAVAQDDTGIPVIQSETAQALEQLELLLLDLPPEGVEEDAVMLPLDDDEPLVEAPDTAALDTSEDP